MPINLLMPALSPTMTEGKLSKWVKKEGDKVKSGDVIAEIETDKATMEFEAVDEGTLGKILVPEGTEGVAVNTPIGVILEEGEDASSIKAPAPAAAPAPAPAPAPAAAAPSPAPAPAAAPAPAHQGDRVFATPLAKRIAKDAGIDIKSLKGSGPHGRIVKADVEFAQAQPGPAKAVAAAGPAVGTPPAAASKPAPAPAFGPAYEEVPLTSIRKVIARRLTEAKQTVTHFYLTIDYKLDALLALRTQLNAKSDTKLSVNDFII
ncbi:MAG TPA: biotin/lipoyl-containing protein, partial [Magnetospirillaceae bacterium]|nr:biotin/lipoyl-containing protein [Magnetospirillaceae bacterium]